MNTYMKIRIVVTLVLAALIAGGALTYSAYLDNAGPKLTPEEAAYAAVVAEHPLTNAVEAVEEASPHAIVIGYEHVTNTAGTETAAVLWAYFDKAGTEEEFVAVHEVALRALVEAFPEADTYLLVWAAYDSETEQARGTSALWLTKIGVSITLQHANYHDGLGEALQHNEAGHIPMRDYGFPALEEPWYPRPEGYVYPWEGAEETPDAEATSDCGCG